MADIRKYQKLLGRIHRLISDLSNCYAPEVHLQINQFFYMQRAEEMQIMIDQLNGRKGDPETVLNWLDENYTSTFHRWRKDVRWLNWYFLDHDHAKAVLPALAK